MSLADLAKLKALCDAATPGSWEVYSEPEVGLYAILMARQDQVRIPLEPLGLRDVEFIAAARTAVPQLLDMVEHLTSGVREMTLAAGEANARAERAEAEILNLQSVNKQTQDETAKQHMRALRAEDALREIANGSARIPTPHGLLARAINIATEALAKIGDPA